MGQFEFERLQLRFQTPPSWVDAVESDYPHFLQDHVACERKAHSVALAFVAKYRDKQDLILRMLGVAQEELAHYATAVQRLFERGIALGPDEKDEYVNAFRKHCRQGIHEVLVDRLLISAIVEARGCERFGLLGRYLHDPQERMFFDALCRAEAKHQLFFLQEALRLEARDAIELRLNELLDIEGEMMRLRPLRASLF